MEEQDATLQYWSERIDSLSAEYERGNLTLRIFMIRWILHGSRYMIYRSNIESTKSRQITNFKSLNIVGACMTGQVQRNIVRIDIF